MQENRAMLIRRLHDVEKPDQPATLARPQSAISTAEPHLPLRKLPPLNALRSFEVAARCSSFTKAAEELLVTPAAVGQQVRQLEDFMGVALFRRENRRLALTLAGESCLPGIREGFAQLVAAVGRAKGDRANGRLTI